MCASKISDLFNMSYGTKFDMNKMCAANVAPVAFVSRSSKNNGVVGFVEASHNVAPLPPGLITVTLGGTYLLSAFLQTKPFYTAQNIIVLDPKAEMSVTEKLFYCMCISKNRFRYSAFGREANRTLKDIRVPSIGEIPDWVEKFNLNKFEGADKPKCKGNGNPPVVKQVDSLGNIFDIYNGILATGLEIHDEPFEGSITLLRPANTIERTVKGYVNRSQIPANHIYPQDSLFVSTDGQGSHTYSYVSNTDSVPNSNVSVLLPKKRMSIEVKMYYARCITENRYLFSYGRKPKGGRLARLKLPAFSDAEIKNVENFVRSLRYSSNL